MTHVNTSNKGYRGLFIPLAWTNITKNRQIYVPFVAMTMFLVAMFMIIRTISLDPGMAKMSGGGTLKMLMAFGVGVMVVFTGVLLFYTNSFLMKRRKKDIGVYNILGFSKRHIARMMSIETIILAFMCILSGIVVGLVGMKLMYLVLLRLTGYPITLSLPLSWKALNETILLFSCFFVGLTLYNIGHITLSNPIELLRGSQVGEREPKSRWLLALSGIVALLGSYYFAVTVTSPLQAITLFFMAVIAVIYGTYALFTTGSIVLLKRLRAHKKFYYQTRHFAVISGMLYRMKQHAAGLATLCILSTMVMISVSTTLSLYVGLEDSLDRNYPNEIVVTINESTDEAVEANKAHILDLAKSQGVSLTDLTTTHMTYSFLEWNEKTQHFSVSEDFMMMGSVSLYLMDHDSFMYLFRASGSEFTSDDKPYVVAGTWEVKNRLMHVDLSKEFVIYETTILVGGVYELPNGAVASPEPRVFLVFPTMESSMDFYKQISPQKTAAVKSSIHFDVEGSAKEKLDFALFLRGNPIAQQGKSFSYVDSRSIMRKDFTDFYGGMLFLGVFLGALFLSATVIIMYYKQITEGYEDKARFETMQKVGMHHEEIKQAISTQTIMVFFLPLVVASIHIVFSFNIVMHMLSLFGFSNIQLFAMCSGGTAVSFALVYLFFYRLTARTYFSIVKWQV